MRRQSSHSSHQGAKRPFPVTILVVAVLIFTCLNFLRLLTAFQLRNILSTLSDSVPVVYLMITGAVWTAFGLPLAIGLFFGKTLAAQVLRYMVIFYAAVYWFDRLFIAEASAIATRWPFALALTVILLVFVYWVLSQPKTKIFMKK